MNSSTGVNEFKKTDKINAIIFLNDTCPNCGNTLSLDVKRLEGADISVRYMCKSCKLICPIYRENDSIRPAYASDINDFLNNFGMDINDRRREINN